MKKLYVLSLLILSLTSCIKKGDESLSGTKIEDITINLLKISPASTVVSPSDTAQFSAVGGNPPYTFSIDSGSGSITNEGLFTAPIATGSTTVQVTDISGNSAYALVLIGNSLQISPASKTIGTSQVQTFEAIGGIAPFTYTKVSGVGSIDSSTGVYTAPAFAGSATIEVRDINNNTSFATVTIVDALTVTPSGATVEDLATLSLSVAGGTAPYTYSIYAGNGSIDAGGLYTAPATETNDIIRVTDTDGTIVEVPISVKFGPQAQATQTNLPPEYTSTISSSSGTAPFSYALFSGTGSIDSSTGVFTAPTQADTTVIRVTDANGFFDDITLTTFNPKKIATNENFACYTQVNSDNTTASAKCWGRNVWGGIDAGSAYYGDDPGEDLSVSKLGSPTPNGLWMGYYYHTCVSFTNNKIKCYGHGAYGKLGFGNQSYYGHAPGTMGDSLNYINIDADVNTSVPIQNRASLGSQHTCVLTSSGSAKCFGLGSYGRLGYGDTAYKCTAASNCGSNFGELELSGGKSITKMTTGHEFTCALIAPDNKVKCWGRSNYGQTGYNTTATQQVKPKDQSFVDLGTHTVKDIASGLYHTCAILDDDSVKCWGRGTRGQLGQGSNQHRGDGAGEMGASLAYTDLGSVSYPTKIYAGAEVSCAIFNNGGLKCWGLNNYGQLGLGNTAYRGDHAGEMGDNLPFVDLGTGRTAVSVSIGERNTCAILDNSSVKCWGGNAYGQLGQGSTDRLGNNAGEMGDNLPAINLGAGISATVSANARYGSCFLTSDNKIKCAGYSESGNFGQASEGFGDEASESIAAASAIDLGTGFEPADVAIGRYTACFTSISGQVKCIGNSGRGVTGQGNQTNLGIRVDQMGNNLTALDLGTGLTATKLSLGYEYHACAVLNNNNVKCWGEGSWGGTGYDSAADRGDGANEMGDNLPLVNVGDTVKKISTGRGSTCAILSDDSVKCWGLNNYGQLGRNNNTYMGDHAGEMAALTSIDLGAGRTAKDIASGYEFSCAALDNNTVKCWGRGSYGALGRENQTHYGNNAGEMGDSLLAADLGNLGTGVTIKKVVAGFYHACALFSDGNAKCWGRGTEGQLGNGIGTHYGDAAGEMGDNLPYIILGADEKILDIAAGGYSTCILNMQNEMKCFGNNPYGQLGQGHHYRIGNDPLSMGDNLPAID
ncbi:MAG: hypothetical protein N4A33_04285 [Bacteriovoracaceae bacterium]|jgi:alpha-tubulin suppressor-like RCC1 family protein|nr:hypothetical protein [Bacteriovoracaceae bacterium]